MKLLILTCLLLAIIPFGQSKKLTRCDFARTLLSLGFAIDSLPNWVCLAEAESSLRTEFVSQPNSNGSYDYGIFQINSQYWCKAPSGPSKSNSCNINCDKLITDDITNSARCAMKIYRQSKNSFRPWYGWRAKCDGKPLPDLSGCFR